MTKTKPILKCCEISTSYLKNLLVYQGLWYFEIKTDREALPSDGWAYVHPFHQNDIWLLRYFLITTVSIIIWHQLRYSPFWTKVTLKIMLNSL